MLNPMHITMKKCSNTVYDVVLPARHGPERRGVCIVQDVPRAAVWFGDSS